MTEQHQQTKETVPAAHMPSQSKFAIIYVICMAILSMLVIYGLTILWHYMEAYEKSRPENAMAQFLQSRSSDSWRSLFTQFGINASYIDSLDLENTSFYKNMEFYTDSEPTYTVCFGGTEVAIVQFGRREEIAFGFHTWAWETIWLTGSGFKLYVPHNATIRVGDKTVGQERLTQENAQELQLSIFDSNRADLPHLEKYDFNEVYGVEDVTVEDENGNILALSHNVGWSYYYAPYMNDYTISVPNDCAVTVNGILLTADNARITVEDLEDFKGIEDCIPFVPSRVTYTVEGLVLPPEVQVVPEQGQSLGLTMPQDDSYLYEITEALPDALSEYIMEVFEAYAAYSGNLNGAIEDNYNRYAAYILPGSEAADRAAKAKGSLYYTYTSKTASSHIASYTAYSEDLFTCQINYTMTGDQADQQNSCLLIFVKKDNAWKVVRVLNKTSLFYTDSDAPQ